MGRRGNVVTVCLLIAFLAVLAAFTVLDLNGEADGAKTLFAAMFSLLGITGLGAHVETRIRGQGRVLDQQTAQLDTITAQTNGVLDGRIESGTRKAIKDVLGPDAGHHQQPPPAPPATVVQPLVVTIPDHHQQPDHQQPNQQPEGVPQ